MNFQIYTMYVNRKDLLIDAINSTGPFMDRVVVIDNSLNQDLELAGFPGEIAIPSVPLFCSQSYNWILKMAIQREQNSFFIMHSDAVVSPQAIDNCLKFADKLNREQIDWGVLFTNYDVLCLHNTSALSQFKWDQYLPLYYTDADFYYRLRLAGIPIIETKIEVIHANNGSSSMKSDLILDQFVRINYPAWRQYYITKWGGERYEETFTTPFNLESAETQ